MKKKKIKIFVAGHKGMVGSAVIRQLEKKNNIGIIAIEKKKLNLIHQNKTFEFVKKSKPDIIIIAAAKVGGIINNNTQRAEFIYENTMIHSNIIHSAYQNNIKKIIFLGSSCIYPKNCKQPMKENDLLDGKFEPTNEPYAMAKMHGIKMCENYNKQYKTNYISIIPSSLYGPNDNYNQRESHVIPALMKKFSQAKKLNSKNVRIWGTGKPKREFLHVDDLAKFIVNLAFKNIGHKLLNVGSGNEITIKQLALLLKRISKYQGNLIFEKSKPDGVFRKLLDSSKAKKIGFKCNIPFIDGLTKIYNNNFQ